MSKASKWAKSSPPKLEGVSTQFYAYLHSSGEPIIGYGIAEIRIPAADALKLGQWLVDLFKEESA